MNTFAAYKKANGMYGIDRVLASDIYPTCRLYSVKGQWTTLKGAIKKIDKMLALENNV